MDHDDYSTDDVMGIAEIDISSLPTDSLVEYNRPLQNVGATVAKGSIHVSLFLQVGELFLKN